MKDSLLIFERMTCTILYLGIYLILAFQFVNSLRFHTPLSVSHLNLKLGSAISDLSHESSQIRIINIFGRIAEHKALGYTSSYSKYSETPLSLWIPNRWSRRLRVNDPDWKKLFGGNSNISKDTFLFNLNALLFMFPIDCEVPKSILQMLKLEEHQGTESELRKSSDIRNSIEKQFQVLPTQSREFDVAYYLFGGRESGINIDIMESKILEWGKLACSDDPVIDYPIFESQILLYLNRKDLKI